MGIVAVHSPCLEHPLYVAVVARPADVIHHLIATVFDQRLTNLNGEGVEHFVPGGSFPASSASWTYPFERIEDTLRIVNLVDGRRTFGAIAATRSRMKWIAFEFADLTRFLVNIGEQAAGG